MAITEQLANKMTSRLEASTRERIISVFRQALIQGNEFPPPRPVCSKGSAYRGLEGVRGVLLLSVSNHAEEELVRENYSDVVKQWGYL
jgi:hypothetical protein